ncbi:NACHT domain-containing NTPase [Kibdelosporangium persicum]
MIGLCQYLPVAKTFSYADAVKRLGAKEHTLVAALDKILGGSLLGGVAFGVMELLSWFDAKVDVVRLSSELLIKAGEKRRGVSRYTRTQRLQAAHAIVVVIAFFDALRELKLPVKLKDLGLRDREDQLELIGLTSLFDGNWLLPHASQPYSQNLSSIASQYERAGAALLQLFKEHDVWSKLEEDNQSCAEELLANVSKPATSRYEELIRQIAGDYPELRFWLQAHENSAVMAGLAQVESALQAIQVGAKPDRRREELARRYRAVLDRPIIDPDEVFPGLSLPSTQAAYIDPAYQVVPMTPTASPAVLSWWNRVPVRHDLHQYLVGYLTSPKAATHPLVVLGDPGSGKSLLTKVLAARLPASDFLTVRVELRTVPTEADLLEQIEHGLRSAVHEDLCFAELCRSAADSLPVLLLDGFDELLQATGVNQTNYLHRIERFQREHLELGRPIAVVVTSRITVSSGMQIPPDTDVLRLTPFNDAQVTQWLTIWNQSNADYFSRNNLVGLQPELALRHRVLAVQPLLLLMLALCDAADNVLHRPHDSLGRAGLYERLLIGFARREVGKDCNDRAPRDLDVAIENELERLAVVALAMFHRGSQWVTEKDLDDDLLTLLGVQQPQRGHGMRTPLSAGSAVLGRFFFMQCAEAQRDSHTLRTYEFLHATFGEYLVARFIWRVLCDLLPNESSRSRRRTDTPLHDDDLHAMLSFTPLTSSRSVIDFLAEMAAVEHERDKLTHIVQRLFALSVEHRARSRDRYRPVLRPAPARYAIYSLNLLVLSVVLRDKLETSTLGIEDWSKLTAFWRSQLSAVEWSAVMQCLSVWWSDVSTVTVTIGDTWPTFVDQRRLNRSLPLQDAARESHFTADPVSNLFRYPFEALPEDRFDPVYARALLEVTASIGEPHTREQRYMRWVDQFPHVVLDNLRRDVTVGVETLRQLSTTCLSRSSAFMVLVCDRIGRGGPDTELIELVEALQKMGLRSNNYEVALVDAWLRLHEIGHHFPAERSYPDLLEMLLSVDLIHIEKVRPDLIKRARTAAKELGVLGSEKNQG